MKFLRKPSSSPYLPITEHTPFLAYTVLFAFFVVSLHLRPTKTIRIELLQRAQAHALWCYKMRPSGAPVHRDRPNNVRILRDAFPHAAWAGPAHACQTDCVTLWLCESMLCGSHCGTRTHVYVFSFTHPGARALGRRANRMSPTRSVGRTRWVHNYSVAAFLERTDAGYSAGADDADDDADDETTAHHNCVLNHKDGQRGWMGLVAKTRACCSLGMRACVGERMCEGVL